MSTFTIQVCFSMLLVHSVACMLWPVKYRWPYEKWVERAWVAHVALWALYVVWSI